MSNPGESLPYPRAHFWLLLLFPLTGLAFWPAYFSDFRAAPYAFHVHGITASLWIALLAFQSWAIHRRRNSLHRSVGLASFALFPFFLVGGLLVLQTMAIKFGIQADPFYQMFGARLGAIDAVSVIALPLFGRRGAAAQVTATHATCLPRLFLTLPPVAHVQLLPRWRRDRPTSDFAIECISRTRSAA